MRTDGAGHNHKYLTWLHNKGVSYSIGFGITDAMVTAIEKIPTVAWFAAVG